MTNTAYGFIERTGQHAHEGVRGIMTVNGRENNTSTGKLSVPWPAPQKQNKKKNNLTFKRKADRENQCSFKSCYKTLCSVTYHIVGLVERLAYFLRALSGTVL